MSAAFIILFVVLTCFTEWSLETTTNTTESYINSTETQSNLLQAIYQSLDCVRLYAPFFGRYYWTDVCDSNSYITPYFMWYTNTICAHRSYLFTRYWIVYMRHGFLGQHIILTPGVCIRNLRQHGIWSVGSILKCTKISQYIGNFYCHRPRIAPWPYDQIPQDASLSQTQPNQFPPEGLVPSNLQGPQNQGFTPITLR
ncbi:unnamed protein product [Schistosoma rodhaini]|uniref:IL4_i_Ig domain-containing protein n=2 Tax=Schistosoma mansoni TaxID=6183 RepID=A0A3Q0KS90_SCHMA|nr:unnamed protein product [Schistosoma rodhaini]